MNNLMQNFEKEQIKKIMSKKRIPAFRPGDTIKVTVKIIEGERSRLQAFEGVCIARKNNSINSKFTVRKISHGEGVERIFPLFSQIIDKIEIIRKGAVKRAKLYYLRNRTGKRTRIADHDRGEEADQYAMTENTESITDKNRIDAEVSVESENNKLEKTFEEQKNIVAKSPTIESVKESVAEKNKSIEEKSESIASEAGKTKDESKS